MVLLTDLVAVAVPAEATRKWPVPKGVSGHRLAVFQQQGWVVWSEGSHSTQSPVYLVTVAGPLVGVGPLCSTLTGCVVSATPGCVVGGALFISSFLMDVRA